MIFIPGSCFLGANVMSDQYDKISVHTVAITGTFPTQQESISLPARNNVSSNKTTQGSSTSEKKLGQKKESKRHHLVSPFPRLSTFDSNLLLPALHLCPVPPFQPSPPPPSQFRVSSFDVYLPRSRRRQGMPSRPPRTKASQTGTTLTSSSIKPGIEAGRHFPRYYNPALHAYLTLYASIYTVTYIQRAIYRINIILRQPDMH
ncbi:hypothetical protein CMEL01_13475 [Colletotrichum melonis]|uniref:Uncharacterized protein n=1 Tax=Colletotrichum melonis TaxID=1209925 RepID=A0AAI9XWL2_9PEZI|nr:hypothetical protein CMEL01_13475 [Colletotrichum melonis]